MNAKTILAAILTTAALAGCFDSDECFDSGDIQPDAEYKGVLDLNHDPAQELEECAGTIGCECIAGWCGDGLACIGGTCGPNPSGQLGFACEGKTECDLGLVCIDGFAGSVCALESDRETACDHGLALESDGVVIDGACVASCVSDSDCGWLTCSEPDGFCVSPVD